MTSTARFMTIWALATLPFNIAGAFGTTLSYALFHHLGVWTSMFVLWAYLLGVGALAGLTQSWIMARNRSRVRGWTAAAVLGALGGLVLGAMASSQLTALGRTRTFVDSAVFYWFYQLMWTSTMAISFAVAEAVALWGRRWTSGAVLWVAGILALRVVPSFLLRMLPVEPALPGYPLYAFSLALLSGVIISAGTAWMLDLLYFRPRAAADPA